jgi:hypothetical protein
LVQRRQQVKVRQLQRVWRQELELLLQVVQRL